MALRCVEMFAGAGGLALGLDAAGIEHEAIIEWDGLPKVVVAEICELDVMVGMGLLRGSKVLMKVEPGGDLTIEQI